MRIQGVIRLAYETSRAIIDISLITTMTDFPATTKKRRRETIFCGHCKRSVAHATFYRHRER